MIKPPSCTAYIFTKIRDKTHHTDIKDVNIGDSTSYNHIILKQAGLILKVTTRLTNHHYHVSTMYIDYATYFIHASLFKGDTDLETFFEMREYKRVLQQFSHKFHSYRSNNSRFDSEIL